MSTVQDLSVAAVGKRIRVIDTDLMLDGVLFSLQASAAMIADRRLGDEVVGDIPGFMTVILKVGRATAQVRTTAQVEVLS